MYDANQITIILLLKQPIYDQHLFNIAGKSGKTCTKNTSE